MKSRGLIAPLLVQNVYDACNFIHKIISSLVLGYIDFYQFPSCLNLISTHFISRVPLFQMLL